MEITKEIIKKFLGSFNMYYEIGPRQPFYEPGGELIYCNDIRIWERNFKNEYAPTLRHEFTICHELYGGKWGDGEESYINNISDKIRKTNLVYLGAEDVSKFFYNRSFQYTKKMIENNSF